MVTAALVALAAPAHADPDVDFDNQLHGYGIYGPRDYNAWLGKITCERLLPIPRRRNRHLLPDQEPVLTSAAGRHE
jgi:hypothetical protein